MLTFTQARKSLGAALAVLALAAGGLGCAFGEIRLNDPMGRLYALEETQWYYSQLVRFGDYHSALRFVDPELQEQYLERTELTIRFTDMQSGPINLDTMKANSDVTVKYLGYDPNTMIEKSYTEKQTWFRNRDGGNNWFVRPYIVDLEEEPPPRVVAEADITLLDEEKAKDMEPAE